MKKIIALLTTVLVISGCTLFSQTKDVDSLTGVLGKQDSNDTYQGTHLLTEESGTENPLMSTALNLSSPQYLGNKVTVQGKLSEETRVFEVTGISVLEVLEKEEGAVKWVEYMDQKMGFKLKYYDNWEVSKIEDKSRESFEIFELTFDLDGDSVIVDRFVEPAKYGDSPSYWAENFTTDVINCSVSEVKVGTDQNNAKEYQCGKEVHYVLSRGNDAYVLSFVPFDQSSENDKIFNEMLAEFQFVPFTAVEARVEAKTNSDEAVADAGVGIKKLEVAGGQESYQDEIDASYTDYSEFESLPYKFKAKYPSGWYYAGTTGGGDVLHRYDFSDHPVTDENKFASLEVLTKGPVSGEEIQLNSGEIAVKKYLGNELYFYVKVGDKFFSVHGSKDKEDILNMIASSIAEVKESDQ